MKSRTILIVGMSHHVKHVGRFLVFYNMGVNQQLSVYTFIWKMNILSILKGKQYIDAVMSKKTVKESMFTAWMEANKIYPHDRKLTYPQYVSSFVCVAGNRC